MEEKRSDKRKQNPRETDNFLSNLFFIWTLPIFAKGNARDLTEDDLYKPLRDHRSNMLGNKLEREWMLQVKTKRKSLVRALWNVFKSEIRFYILINFFLVFAPKLCQPILLMQVLNYYVPGQTSITDSQALLYVIAIILIIFVGSISGHTYVMGMIQLGMKLRVAICSLVYRKILKFNKYSINDTSTGQIVTLLSNDVRMFDYIMLEVCLLIIAPSELIADTILLYFLLGKTALVGIAFVIIFIPLQMYNGKLSAKYRLKIARKTDKRVLLMNEIISGIRVIKMYTWEKPFSKLVEIARRLEIKQIRGAAYVNAFMHSYSMYMSRTAQFMCILFFVLNGQTPVAQYVFVITSFYNNLTKTVSVNFPDAISTFAECSVSCKRIETLLGLDEIEPTPLLKNVPLKKNPCGENDDFVLKLSNVSAKWNDKEVAENTLSGINLEMKSTNKFAVIGVVGSGKSSLMNVVLKELPIHEGNININGNISYAAQESWLFKGSIRQNILFGSTFDPDRYKEVVKVCGLQKDLELFPFGDLSIVGEKGVMLSGGQKARINLARAVYREADLYLFDDPLSAVDTLVGKQLYEQCICGYLSKKCVLLITHQLQYLKTMDRIFLMENGTFVRSGTYQDLQKDVSSLVKYLGHSSEDDEDEKYDLEITDHVDLNDKEAEKEESPTDMKEIMSTGAMSANVYKQYFKAGGKWYIYVPVISMFLITQICASSADYFITFWVNLEQYKANGRNKNSSNITVDQINRSNDTLSGRTYSYSQSILSTELCIYIYTICILVLIVLSLVRSTAFFQYCLSASTSLHNNMFRVIAKAPMRFFDTNPSGRILNRFTKDIGAIDELLPVLLLDTIEIGITVIAVSIILASINTWMLIPTIVIMVLFYCYKQYYIKTSRSVKRIEGTARSPIFSHLAASLQGLTTIRAFECQNKLIEEFDSHQDMHTSAYYLFLSCNRAFGLILDMNCIIYVAIVTVSTFFTASFGGNVGLSITQAMGLTGRMQWGVRQWSEAENQMTSVERVLEYSNLESEPDKTKKPPKGWPHKGTIQFKSVSMSYAPGEPQILRDLSFSIAAKAKIGIVGRTGAGKSSIISAIFRLTPFEGEILIDELDTSSISLESLRSKISIIPQEPFLFSGTLRDNLDPFKEYDDDTLWNALKKVELKTLVAESAHGLNYEVSEGGKNFSAGQRQLICLARAIVRRNNILIMDEATANVDPKTDELIQATIRTNFDECTVLTIAHRLHTIMDSDKVMVMDSGRLVEFDHPHTLLNNIGGIFHCLVMETGKGISDNLKEIAKKNYLRRNAVSS
ncbi:probable multidrug resistance-associated protein lethal(2)03659 [Harmonia axyridis]|uniref:probable multidrug resistance-associated protein lethal(2)03659 n=1 Tax=Harmonia axyridis TaxID=115357 RepID=UPI001E2794F9|nr:probable multidrug resistance-associated protein lethal(2)03659 [Harmonia axyridis]XP_045472449.1 probable multidrug resistance-associated protein lethal(2)03659 [Harmonia axyridis]